MMHSMVGAFGPYIVKRRRVEIVRGYCYRFFQCSFPCGILMLISSILFIVIGSTQLIYIIHFNGCLNPTTLNNQNNRDDNLPILSSSSSLPLPLPLSSSFKCNRQTMKVIGITFVVTGCVLFLISLVITKYSRSSEENNIIRTTTSSLLANNTKSNKNQPHQHHASSHYHHGQTSLTNDENSIVVCIR